MLDDVIVFRLAGDRYLLVRERRQHRGGPRVDRRAHAARTSTLERSQRRDRAPGAAGSRGRARRSRTLTPLDLTALRRFTVREAVGGRRRGTRLAHRLHRRGRLRALRAGQRRRAPCGTRSWRRSGSGTASPCGLGARDTLRLEAGLPLYGTDMDTGTTPLEAGLGWVVKLQKGEFVGRDALARQAADGSPRRLVGLQLDEPGIPRHGHAVLQDGDRIGTVTSGTQVADPGRRSSAWLRRQPRAPAGRRRSRSRFAAGACRPTSSIVPSTAERHRERRMELPDDLHYTDGARVAAPRGRRGHRSASPTSRRRRSATSSSSSCLPSGMVLTAGQTFGVVESNKSVSDLFAPVAGRVVAVNDDAARTSPRRSTTIRTATGWMIRIAVDVARRGRRSCSTPSSTGRTSQSEQAR